MLSSDERPGTAAAPGEVRKTEPPRPKAREDKRPAEPDSGEREGDAAAEGKKPDGDDDRPAVEPKSFIRRHPIAIGVAAVLLVGAAIWGVLWWMEARHFETTDDAFVDSRAFAISAKVGGYLVDVPVTDNQHVEAGALIGQVDPRDYRVARDQAQAQLDAALANVQSAEAQVIAQQSQVAEAQAQVQQSEAALEFSRDENRRAQELVQRGAGTVQRAQQTASDLTQAQANLARTSAAVNAANRQIAVLEAQRKSADANVEQARAQLAQAELNLRYTEIRTAQGGRIAKLTAAKGQLVQAGQALSMLVPDALWITANFKETQLTAMRPGQDVEMTIDAYPDRVIHGRVDSIQPGSGTAFSLLPAQNATGNYVKVVQRVPVKLVFEKLPGDVAIGPGMSVVPKVRVR